jgi:5-methylcytosine-specific restriction enzyme subunit McrC
MTTLELAEHGPAISVPLDDADGRALARSRLVNAAPDPDASGHWKIRAGGTVGAATVHTASGTEVTLHIAPKLPIARLLFLLGYSRSSKGWRDKHVHVGAETGLLPAFARLFAREAGEALRRGPLTGYRRTEETALVVQGRIRLGDQLRRHHGRLVPVEISHNEYTPDIAENRLLRSACDALLRLPGYIAADVRTSLLRLRLLLAGITPIARGDQLPAWRRSRLNARYHHALRLAELVLHGDSVEHRPGDVAVYGFLFDMAKIFEDFVTTALREALAHHDGHCILQATHYLDDERAIRLIPDFVRYGAKGTPLAVADAKYKAEKPKGFPDADLYQMLAYCTALNLPEGHLVYAKGNAPYGAHRVRHAGIKIHQHALDLELPPTELLEQIYYIADRLTSPLG